MIAARRVVLVSPYALSVPGGAQGQVRLLAIELARRGRDVTVCSPGAVDEGLVAAGVVHAAHGAVTSVPANGSRAPITLSLRAAAAFASIVADADGAVVHVHEPFAPVAPYLVLRAHRRATVATFHRGGGGPAYRVGRPLITRLARGIDLSVAVSGHAADTIRAGAGIDAEVIFNGVDVDAAAAATPWPTTGPTVLFVGRHEERKGLRVLLEALAHLEQPVVCWIAGDGPQSTELRRRFAADGRLVWLGRISEAEKRERMAGADVVCVPSLGGESFGLVPLEAMAAGTAVVCSDIDGYREAAGGFATLVAPGDPAALADALREAVGHPASHDALERAGAHARGWSIPALVDRYEPLYALAERAFAARTGGAAR